ncbi:unnamed protein product [Calicophoron daubneyi]|uniref:Coiled-coil alpha-helical rod protein 1 n=1 Tax=Calicophoron daubneyi TaxID=300641 RepID=A0AAV2T200_CALDB
MMDNPNSLSSWNLPSSQNDIMVDVSLRSSAERICLDDESLLPPSAFLVTKSASEYYAGHQPQPDMSINSNSRYLENRISSLLSQMTAAEARCCDLKEQIRAMREENLRTQLAKDEALRKVATLKAYIESGNGKCDLPKITVDRSCSTVPLSSGPSSERIVQLEEEKSRIERELDLSLVRIHSLEAVLQLQEAKICSLNSKESGTKPEVVDKLEKSAKLLTFWRTRVLHLLMQEQELKVAQEHAIGQMRRQCEASESKRRETEAEIETLRLKLRASEAAVATEHNKITPLRVEVKKLKEKSRCMQIEGDELHRTTVNSLKAIGESVSQLYQNIALFMCPDLENGNTSTASSPHVFRRLRQLERRLSFALDRLPLLRAHSAVKRQLMTEKFDQQTQTSDIPGFSPSETLTFSEMQEMLAHVQAEAECLRSERDVILAKLEENTRSFQQRVETAQNEVRIEVTTLCELTHRLETLLNEKQEELNSCLSQVESLKVVNSQIQQEAAEEQTRLKAQLIDTQKKLAKATVEVKRAERRISQELDERKIRIAELESSYKSRIQSLEHALQSFCPGTYTWYADQAAPFAVVEQATTSETKQEHRAGSPVKLGECSITF